MDRPELLDHVLGGLAAWTVLVVQYNGMIADRVGVSATDLQCLYALEHGGPATVGALAKRVNLTTGSASRMVDRLDAAGHVRRTPDPSDRRRVLIEATRDAVPEVADAYALLNERLRADLGEFDEEQLARLLRFLRAAELSTEEAIRGF